MGRTTCRLWTLSLVAAALSLLPRVAAGQCNVLTSPPPAKLAVKDRVSGANDRLGLRGDFVLPTSTFAGLNPLANGATITVEDANGAIVVQQVLPAGAYDPATKQGWTLNGGQSIWRFRNNVSGSPATNGIRRLILIDRNSSQPNRVRLRVIGVRGSYPLAGAVLPLKATVVVDNVTGDCGETAFLSTDCVAKSNSAINSAKCRQ